MKSSSNSERANLRVLKLNERPTFSMKACNFPEKSELSSVKTRTTKNILKDKEAQKNECLKQEATNTHIKKTHFTKRKTGHQMLWRTKKEKTVREIWNVILILRERKVYVLDVGLALFFLIDVKPATSLRNLRKSWLSKRQKKNNNNPEGKGQEKVRVLQV